MASQKPSEEEISLIAKIEKTPGDLESRYKLAKIQADAGRYPDAIESCLQMLAIDRNWNNKAAN